MLCDGNKYTYIRAYIHTYIHTYVHAYIHTHLQTYIHILGRNMQECMKVKNEIAEGVYGCRLKFEGFRTEELCA